LKLAHILHELFQLTLCKLISFSPNEKIVVACSGGLDSLCLTLLCKEASLSFEAAIVDHKYRKKSSEDTNKTKNILDDLAIKSTILENPYSSPENNVEEELRKVRYELLLNFCKKNNIKQLFIGHHLDDQIETFLMRLQRGSGLEGLSAIKTESEREGVKIFRPLLSFKKNDLENYLIERNVQWIEDESNEDERFTRNKVRQVLEKIEGREVFSKRIETVISNISRANDFIGTQVDEALGECFEASRLGFFKLNLKKFSKLHQELQLRILRLIIEEFSDSQKDLRLDKLLILNNFLLNNKSDDSIALHYLEFVKDRDCCFIIKEKSRLPRVVIDGSNVNHEIEWAKALRLITSGNIDNSYIEALGDSYPKEIKDNIKNLGINRKVAAALPALKNTEINDGEKIEKILCIPHISCINDSAKCDLKIVLSDKLNSRINGNNNG
jgi:tRNA(Ile)-lysidine synthase